MDWTELISSASLKFSIPLSLRLYFSIWVLLNSGVFRFLYLFAFLAVCKFGNVCVGGYLCEWGNALWDWIPPSCDSVWFFLFPGRVLWSTVSDLKRILSPLWSQGIRLVFKHFATLYFVFWRWYSRKWGGNLVQCEVCSAPNSLLDGQLRSDDFVIKVIHSLQRSCTVVLELRLSLICFASCQEADNSKTKKKKMKEGWQCRISVYRDHEC